VSWPILHFVKIRRIWNRPILAGVLALIGAASIALLVSSDAKSRPSVPTYALKVAGGRLPEGARWGAWLFGRHHAGCWASKTVEDGFTQEDAYCGFALSRRYWQMAARGYLGSKQKPKSMLFFLTRPGVRALSVQLKVKSQQSMNWIHVNTRAITPTQAKRAHMRLNFKYSVSIRSGSYRCIRTVIVFGRSGNVIQRSHLPPCGKRAQAPSAF